MVWMIHTTRVCKTPCIWVDLFLMTWPLSQVQATAYDPSWETHISCYLLSRFSGMEMGVKYDVFIYEKIDLKGIRKFTMPQASGLSCWLTNNIFNSLLQFISNYVPYFIVFTRAIGFSVGFEDISKCPTHVLGCKHIVVEETRNNMHLTILVALPSASLQINARRWSMKFQYFSPPLHSTWMAR